MRPFQFIISRIWRYHGKNNSAHCEIRMTIRRKDKYIVLVNIFNIFLAILKGFLLIFENFGDFIFSENMNTTRKILFLASFLIKCFIFWFFEPEQYFKKIPFFNSAFTDIEEVEEGIFMMNKGVNPYEKPTMFHVNLIYFPLNPEFQ